MGSAKGGPILMHLANYDTAVQQPDPKRMSKLGPPIQGSDLQAEASIIQLICRTIGAERGRANAVH